MRAQRYIIYLLKYVKLRKVRIRTFHLPIIAAESQEAGNTTPASSTDHKRKGAYALFKKKFPYQPKEAATQAACAGNTRGYHSECGNSWFNNRENDDAHYMFRSYNNCYYSSSEPVTDEEDEL